MKIESTHRNRITIDSIKNMIILFLLATILSFLGFKAIEKSPTPEYRPIAINYRSVSAATAYQPSATRNVLVNIPVQIACTVTLSGGQAGNYVLQTSPDNITYTTVAQLTNSSTGTLVVGLTLNNTNGASLSAVIAPNYYYKLVSTATTGTPTFSILTNAQEVSL